jgi:hypothetical protein
MLVFEEPETKVLRLGKAVPRAWLESDEDPVVVQNATTRYGRVSFIMQAAAATEAAAATGYVATINVTVPTSWAAAASGGGTSRRADCPRSCTA